MAQVVSHRFLPTDLLLPQTTSFTSTSNNGTRRLAAQRKGCIGHLVLTAEVGPCYEPNLLRVSSLTSHSGLIL